MKSQLYLLEKKKTTPHIKWAHTVQSCVVQGSTVYLSTKGHPWAGHHLYVLRGARDMGFRDM